jgi:uroporphyrinogen III methyltransferase/synthase
LITRRGLELIRSADVVLYDRLVAPALVAEARPDAETIFVGKRPGEVHSRQVIADALLVSKAKEDRSVVRLKGGDPFVFGRGAEEARLLAEASIPFEIVPGVSSAIAVPAYAGIPVTERGVAGSFAVLTARDEEGDIAPVALSVAADTLVLLMGVDALERVAGALIDGGRSPDEAAAVIEWGTTPAQRTVTGTLADIAERVRAHGLGPPAITVVGRVVETRATIAWFEERPLFGRSVVLTRAADRSGTLAARLHELGAQVLLAPVIDVGDPTDRGPLERAVKDLDRYAWVVFSSATAVEGFFGALEDAGNDARALSGARIAAVGPATASALTTHGLRADLVARGGTAAALVKELGGGQGNVLWPRAEVAPADPVDELRAAGWTVDEVATYRTIPATPPEEVVDLIRSHEVDAIVFTSASTVGNFETSIGRPADIGADRDRGPAVVCIGPDTEAAAKAAGFTVAAVATPHTTDGLVAAIQAAFARAR